MKLVFASLLCLLGSVGYSFSRSAGADPEAASMSALALPDEAVAPSPVLAWTAPVTDGRGWVPPELEQLELADDPVDGHALVRGHVGADRGALAFDEVTVEAIPRDRTADQEPHPAAVFEDGAFELELPPGDWTLVARAPDRLPAVIESLPLSAGESLEGVNLTLTQGGRITGVVRADGEPAAGVKVLVEGRDRREVAWTDDDGAFVAGTLLPGAYRVRVHDAHLGSDERDALVGQSVALDLTQRTLRGVVVGPDGAPAAGAWVFVRVGELPESPRDAWTTEEEESPGWECADGTCELTADELGRFEVQVPSHAPLTVAASHGELRALVRDLPPPGAADVVVTLQPGVPARVRLLAAGGEPAAGLQVTLVPTGLHLRQTVVISDDAGEVHATLFPGQETNAFPPQGHQLEAIAGRTPAQLNLRGPLPLRVRCGNYRQVGVIDVPDVVLVH